MIVAILLATYNSEKFLNFQIDSILNQTYKDFVLYIRDDGSVDKTLSIIEDYIRINSNIILLNDNQKRRKSMMSFMWMLDNIDADYYMFSDHDDVWLENKIELSLNEILKLESFNKEKAIVVHTDLQVVDKDLKLINKSFWSYSKINPSLLRNKNYLAVYNGITGCSMIINKLAKFVSFPIEKNALMHDSWIALKGINSGGLIGYLDNQTVLYRQHDNNVIGAKNTISFYYYLSKILFIKKSVLHNYYRYKMVNDIFNFNIYKYIFYKILYYLKR